MKPLHAITAHLAAQLLYLFNVDSNAVSCNTWKGEPKFGKDKQLL